MMARVIFFLIGAATIARCGGSSSSRQNINEPQRYGPSNPANQSPKFRDFAPSLSGDGSKVVFLSYRVSNQPKAYKRDVTGEGATSSVSVSGKEAARRALISSDGKWIAVEERDGTSSHTIMTTFAGDVQHKVKHPSDNSAKILDTILSTDSNPLLVNVYKIGSSVVESWVSGVDAQGQIASAAKLSGFDQAERNLSFVGDLLISSTTNETGVTSYTKRATGSSAATLAAANPVKVDIDVNQLVLPLPVSGSAAQSYLTVNTAKQNVKVFRYTDKKDLDEDKRASYYAGEQIFPVNLATGALGEAISTTFMTRVKSHANASGDLVLIEGLDSSDCAIGVDVNTYQRGPSLALYDATNKRLTRILFRQPDPDLAKYEITNDPCAFETGVEKKAIFNRNFSDVTLASGSNKDKVTIAFTLLDRIDAERADYEVYWLQFGIDDNGAIVNSVLKNVSENRP